MPGKIKILKTVPVTIQWLLRLWVIYLLIFTVLRIVLVLLFRPANISFSSLFPSFWLGFRFDAKWISILLLPIALLSFYSRLSPFYSVRTRRWWSFYLVVVTLVVLFFFGADFGNFSYNHTRINASALNFAEDPVISLKMLWQSYPMIWILLALALAVVIMAILFKRTHFYIVKKNEGEDVIYQRRWHALVLIFLLWSVFGIFSFHPIKWKDAFELNDNFKSYVALNPLQNFFTTLQFRRPSFDEQKAKEYYPVIADLLQLSPDERASKSYQRDISKKNDVNTNPNVVLVICESFSMYKSSMSGNPLNTTPYFNGLCDSGIFFTRCFSPTFGTARGVFSILTGIPDVQLSEFSTRNPEAINQHIIINSFRDYDRLYFLGGSSEFNNFDGIVKNINGIRIYQDGSYRSRSINVWGISDKNLFLEAGNVLSQEQNPFFAIIQTADNHRPFTIPEEDKDFERRNENPDTLKKYGFESLQEFQSFCYSDYCFKKFMQAAKQQAYYRNTIFVFVGDHGVEGEAMQMYPDAWTSERLSDEHIPLLFYCPALLPPQKRNEVVSQIDILPTIAGMLHQSYVNTTLGRDVLDKRNKTHAAFIIHHDEGNIGVVTDDYYFVKNIRISKEDLASVTSNQVNLSKLQQDSVKRSLSALTSAIYETAKWMLVNNKIQ